MIVFLNSIRIYGQVWVVSFVATQCGFFHSVSDSVDSPLIFKRMSYSLHFSCPQDAFFFISECSASIVDREHRVHNPVPIRCIQALDLFHAIRRRLYFEYLVTHSYSSKIFHFAVSHSG